MTVTVEASERCLSGRMKASSRSPTRCDVRAGRARRTTAVFLSKVLLRPLFDACVCVLGPRSSASCDPPARRSDTAVGRAPSRTACAAVGGPWPRWPWPCRCVRSSRWRMASWRASHWHKVTAAWHKAQRSTAEPALVMLPLWVRPADSLRSAVMPAQNSRASALGKRSKGPISAAMIRLQISPMPGTDCRMSCVCVNALATSCPEHLASQSLAMALGEQHDVQAVGERLVLSAAEQMALGQAANVGRRRRRTSVRADWWR